ncbi:isochorismatase [Nitrospirillum viridazoti Y2]|uniref:Nicotinamidase-related amidase n=1 Tax=Nitrospirillum amazonense TaxID=28077 RepID=A0A560IUQ0_9PROT|nr:hydrolase [Nitrospirillum amazonense]EGY00773.1 isochorismatase [Nitrospirillum amazonense Y2]TWB62291.1 nicotinamidase-related amidase [Nitrospirillum amazonense]
MSFNLDPKTTALVLIDLQHGIVNLPLAPHTGAEVLARSKVLADRFRAAGAPVVLVRVAFAPDFSDAPRQPTDQAMTVPPGGFPANWATLDEDLVKAGDIIVTKRQWGAFYGTDLDLQLRRRGVTTIVLAGIATNIGVESTARGAWEHGYALVFPTDAMSTFNAEMQDFALNTIFPRLGRRTTSDAITLG